MATPKVIYKSAKASPAVKAAPAKMSTNSKRVITIASVTLFAVLILGLFLFFGQKFVGKAIAFDTAAIGPGKIGIPISGSAEIGEIVSLPVYANLGAEKSYAFSVKVQYSPLDFVEFQEMVVPEGIVVMDKEIGSGYVKIVGASLGDGENAPLALTGKVNLFTLSFKVIDEGGVALSVPEAEMYNEQGNKISLTSVESVFEIKSKPTPVAPESVKCSVNNECTSGQICQNGACASLSDNFYCGDGEIDSKVVSALEDPELAGETITEACDDHNTISGDGCSMGCTQEAGWQCSGVPSVCQKLCTDECSPTDKACDASGNYLSCQKVGVCWKKNYKTCQVGTSCSEGSCVVPVGVCGNGKIDSKLDPNDPEGLSYISEACDDGNAINGDGCSSTCVIENPEVCTGGIDEDGDGAADCADTDCAALAQCKDIDKDGVIDSVDNCPYVNNPNQKNSDGDELGDACDTSVCGSHAALVNGACVCDNSFANKDVSWVNGCEACAEGYEMKEGKCVVKVTDLDSDGIIDSQDLCSANGEKNLVYTTAIAMGCYYGDTDKSSCVSSAEYTLFKAKYKNNADSIQDTISSSIYTLYKAKYKTGAINACT